MLHVAYDEDLANRIRELIAGEPDVTEMKVCAASASSSPGSGAASRTRAHRLRSRRSATVTGAQAVEASQPASPSLTASWPADSMMLRSGHLDHPQILSDATYHDNAVNRRREWPRAYS